MKEIRKVLNKKIILIYGGDILKSRMKTIVIPVNCVGVMGKGLALEVSNRLPQYIETRYKNKCKKGYVKPGRPIYTKLKEEDRIVMLFPTKDHWRKPALIEYINNGLKSLTQYPENSRKTFESMAFPMLGCGAGRLSIKEVYPKIVDALKTLDIEAEIYL